MRSLVGFLCRRELCRGGADGGGSLVEILARGEAVRGELGVDELDEVRRLDARSALG
jgi:hypothetical protein